MMRQKHGAPARSIWVGFALAAGFLCGCDAPPPSPPGPFGVGSAEGTASGGTTGGDEGNDPVNLPPNAESSGTTLPMFTAGDTQQTSGTGDTEDASETEFGETSTETSTGEDEPEALPCDAGFSISPLHPTTASFFVEATHVDPLAYIELAAYGPNIAEASYVAVVGESPWKWRFQVSGHIPGVYTLDFGNAPSEGGPVTVHSTCQIEVTAP